MQGIAVRHAGIELSAEILLSPNLWLRAAAVLSDNRYTADPVAFEEKETTGTLSASNEKVHYDGLRVSGAPQQAGTLTFEYRPRGWQFSASLNAFGGNYVSPAPLRRTDRALGQAGLPSESLLSAQECFGTAATVDLFVGRTFYLRGSQRLGVYAGVDNLLDRRDIVSGGYESTRLRDDAQGGVSTGYLYPLGSYYRHAPGLNFFVTASFWF